MSQPTLLQTPESIREMAGELASRGIIGIDTEFIRETTFFPKIALVQLATVDRTWLVDPTVLSPEDLRPLTDVLLDSRILKVMHAAFADQECLYWAYGITAEPVLDTAVAAALCGYGDNAGLGKLLKEICRVTVPKGRARVKWLTRPLPRELLQYAEQDVAHLVRLGSLLIDELKHKNRLDWAMVESVVDPKLFDTPPEEMAARLAKSGQMDSAGVNALVELVRWRESRARNANLPRAWVAGNEVLVSLAKVRPQRIDELKSFRGLNVKEVERQGDRILEAIRRGMEAPREKIMVPARAPMLTDAEDHVLDLIRTYVAFLAASHEIAPRFLINAAMAAALIPRSELEVGDWIREGILSEPAARLIGDDLKALLQGRKALVLKKGRVEILSV